MKRELFQGLNASLVCDAMQQLYGPEILRDAEISGVDALGGKPAIGFAYTVRASRIQNPQGTERDNWFQAIDEAPSGAFFVIQARGEVGGAVFGEMVALRLKAIGLAGALVDGYSRDINQIVDMGFPYWTMGKTMRGMVPNDAFTETHIDLCIGNVKVSPGDLIAADGDGAIVCPKEYSEDVLKKARTFLASEIETQKEVKNGRRLIDVYPSKSSFVDKN